MHRSAVRNATFSEIRGKVALLGNTYKSNFANLVDRTVGEEGKEKLGLAVRKRDDNAHKTPPDITFRELEEAFVFASDMVDALRITLEK